MGYFLNREELLAHGNIALREIALSIVESGLAGADPGLAARKALRLEGDTLLVGSRHYDLSGGARIFVVGAGKASFPIAKAIDDIVGPRIHRGLVVCKQGQVGTLEHIALHLAAHPLPDAQSRAAAWRTSELLGDVRPGDIVLACFTGGSSSLFVDPVEGISLEDKARTSRILLTCGANIVEINAVRKHISRVKGGRLVQRLPAGVHLVNLTVSDVIGDPLDYITDPSVPDTSSFKDARATLDKYALWDRLPASVTAHLKAARAEDETVPAGGLAHLDRHDVLLVRSDAACRSAAEAARALGFEPLVLSTFFEGESRELGRSMAAIAKQIRHDGSPLAAPCVLIGGGETTVLVDGEGGRGGPNQEFAVAVALELAGDRDIVGIGVDTDGTDGPTGIAGGMVDGTTAAEACALGLDLHGSLQRHDVSTVLGRLGCAAVTGQTGTNVNDLKLLLIANHSSEPTCPSSASKC